MSLLCTDSQTTSYSDFMFRLLYVCGPLQPPLQLLSGMYNVRLYFTMYWFKLQTPRFMTFMFEQMWLDLGKLIQITHLWPDLRKAGFHAHNSKTHFSPSNNSCTRWLTIQPGVDAESCPGCFCCGLFLRLVRRPRVYGSPSNGCISPWQADSWL